MDFSKIDTGLLEGLKTLYRDMRTHGYKKDDPVREVFSTLGDRWSTLILLVLSIGPVRHAELLRIVRRLSEGAEGRISQRVLTAKLRALERDGFVGRDISDDIPPKVTYALSDLGRSLVEQATQLMHWVQIHDQQIREAREKFDTDQN